MYDKRVVTCSSAASVAIVQNINRKSINYYNAMVDLHVDYLLFIDESCNVNNIEA